MTRYRPSRNFLFAGIALIATAAAALALGGGRAPVVLPAGVLAALGVAGIFVSLRPSIEIHQHHLRVGGRVIPWQHVRGVSWSGWVVPMIVSVVTEDNERLLVVYAGSPGSARLLLLQIRRAAREALIDGVPYREYWNGVALPAGAFTDSASAAPARQQQAAATAAANRYPLLRQEDEAEVERLYQRLKVVGHLDSKGNDEP